MKNLLLRSWVLLLLVIGCTDSSSDNEMGIPNGTEETAIPLTVDVSVHEEVDASSVAYYSLTPTQSGSYSIYLDAENDANLWLGITADAIAFNATCGYEQATCSDSVTCGGTERYCTFSLEADTRYVISVHNIQRVSRGGGTITYINAIDTQFMLLVSSMGGEGTLATPTPILQNTTLESECVAWNFSYYSFTPSQTGYAISISNLSMVPDQGVAVRVGTAEQITSQNGWSCMLNGNGSCPISVPPNTSQIIQVSVQHNGDPGAETITYGLTLELRSGMGTPGEPESFVSGQEMQGTLDKVEGDAIYEEPNIYFTANSVSHYAVIEPSVSGYYGFILDAPTQVAFEIAPIGGTWPDDVASPLECPFAGAEANSDARLFGAYLDFTFERPHLVRIYATSDAAEYSLTMMASPSEITPTPIELNSPMEVIGIPNTTQQYFLFTAPKATLYVVDTQTPDVGVSSPNSIVDENGITQFSAAANEQVLLTVTNYATCWPTFQLTVYELESDL